MARLASHAARRGIVHFAALLLVGGILQTNTAAAEAGDRGGDRPPSKAQSDELSPMRDGPWEREFVPGEVLVGFEPGVGRSARSAVLEEQSAALEERLPLLPGVQLVRVGGGTSVREAVGAFERQPEVRYAEPNFIYQLSATPDDLDFGKLWGLHNTGQTVNGTAGMADADIDAPEAWDLQTGSPSIQVAVVDSGISYDHPDLAANMWTNPGETGGGKETNGLDDDSNGYVDDWRGWDFGPVLESPDNDPFDTEGHGTHVAGTIGARGNNAAGVSGVNWQVQLMNLRVCAFWGCDNADIASAFAYAGNKGAEVVNASLGGSSSSATQIDAITNAPNTLFVVAAGNGGSDGIGDDNDSVSPAQPQYPCNYTNANLICVAATDQDDDLTSFSNYGTTSVDLAAPGNNVFSSYPYETVLLDNFETDIAGRWTHGGTNDTWERSTEASASPIHSLSDSPGAAYANDTDSWARTNALAGSGTLADVQHPLLNYTGCTNSPTCSAGDQLKFEYSTDGGTTWTGGTKYYGYTSTSSWSFVSGHRTGTYSGTVRVTFPGSPPTVPCADTRLRFRFITNASGTNDGVYVDNFKARCYTSRYEYLPGTSMASPHVAGAAALIFAEYPGATVSDVKNGLLTGVDAKASLAGKVATGGRLNIHKALLAADTDPPETFIDSGPSGTTNDSTPEFTFSSDEAGSTFQCRVDSGDWANCTSPHTTVALADGPHSFEVKATDSANNTDPSPASSDFTVDTASPETTISSWPSNPTNFAAGAQPFSVAVGDFNGDSDPDLAVANVGTDDVSILLGAAGGTFTGPTNFGVGDGPFSVATGDFDGDSDLDLATSNYLGDNISILLGNGAGTFSGPTNLSAGDGPNHVALGDLNGDSDPDLAVTNGISNNVSIFLGAAGGTFGAPSTLTAAAGPVSVAVGDFNGDSDPDLAVAMASGVGSDVVSIFLGDTGGTFTGPTDYTVGDGGGFNRISIGDFNGDSDPDLVVPNLNSHNVSVLLGAEAGTFTGPTTFATAAFPGSVAVADLDGDSDLDLAVAPNYALSSLSILLGTGDGSFSGRTDIRLVTGGHHAVASDFNADGDPDLAVGNGATNDVSIFLGAPTANFWGTINDPTPPFQFSSDEGGATFACRVDSGSWATCTSPHSTVALTDGPHTFEVRATDLATNTDLSPGLRHFIVDATDPSSGITFPENGGAYTSAAYDAGCASGTADVCGTASDATSGVDRVEVRIQRSSDANYWTGTGWQAGEIWVAPTGATSWSFGFDPTEDTYTLSSRATDEAGNVEDTATVTFIVDDTAPTDPTTVDSPSHDSGVVSNDATVDITWSGAADTGGSGVDGFSYLWDTSAGTTPDATKDAEEGATGMTSDPLADGSSHWFHLRTKDNAGNWTSTVHLGPFVIETPDTDAPETTITSGPHGTTVDDTPTFSFTASESATFECRLDSGTWESCTSPYTAASLGDGPHTFWVRATDGTGNVDASPALEPFTVNTTPGTIVGWGSQPTPPAGSDFIALDAGEWYTLALRTDGSLAGVGDQPSPPAGSGYVAVSSGYLHSLALKSDGSIVGWGDNGRGQATPPSGNEYVAISAGTWHSLALKSDGSIVGWGYNGQGQATPPAGNDYVAIAAGYFHSLALKSDGSIVGWGSNTSGQISTPAGTDFVAIAAGSRHSLGLKSDGTVVGWGDNSYGKATPPAGTFEAIGAGDNHSVALRSAGSLVGWGLNSYGQATPPPGNEYRVISAGWNDGVALSTDTTPPTDPTPSSPSHTVGVLSNDNTVEIGWSGASDPGSGVDGFSFEWSTSSDTTPDDTKDAEQDVTGTTSGALSDGGNWFHLRTRDNAGNWTSTVHLGPFVIDADPPETTIDWGPGEFTGDNTPGFAFSSDEDGSTFLCRVDSGDWVTCVPPWYHAYLDGPHTFEVKATDPAGNTDPTPDEATFTVDTIPPSSAITFPGDGSAQTSEAYDAGCGGATADLCGTATDAGGVHEVGVRIQRSNGDYWNGSTWQADATWLTATGTTSWAYGFDPAEGAYTVGFRAIDHAGGTEVANTAAFIVDDTDPTDPTPSSSSHIVGTPSNDDTVAITWSGAADPGSGVDGFSFSWGSSSDSTPDETKDAEQDVTGTTSGALPEGDSWFHLRTRDNAGNWTSTVHLGPFVIDTDPPETSITDGPSGTTTDATPEFAFTSDEEGSTFRCMVDSGSWELCASPYETDALADGAHTFSVKATDTANNTDTSAASQAFSVDTTDPEVTIESGPSGATNVNSPTFAFSADEPVTWTCKLDDGVFGACSGGGTYSPGTLEDGPHSVFIRGTDVVSHASTVERGFTVDTVNPADPSLESSHAVGTPSNDNIVPITWSGASDVGGTGVDGFSFSWSATPDTTPDATKDAEQDVTGTTSGALPEGDSWFHLRTRDNAGNWTSTVHHGPFVIDTIPPTSAVTFPTEGSTYSSASFASGCGGSLCGSSSDVGSGIVQTGVWIQRMSDGLYWNGVDAWQVDPIWLEATGTSSWSYGFTPSAGMYKVKGRATDAAGNVQISPVITFTIDDTFQLDALIRKGTSPWVGNNIVNTTASGQSVLTKARRGQTRTFTVRVRNDDNLEDSFLAQGPGSSTRFVVRYHRGTIDITPAVRAGTYAIEDLGPGESAQITIDIKPRKRARIGSIKSVLVTISSVGDPTARDAVKARVEVRRG